MLAIIIPAHNEEAFIGQSLQSAVLAAADPALANEAVTIIVVCDSCTDATETIAAGYPVIPLTIFSKNVGAARAAGAAYALELGARWLAFTDANTLVPNNWLSQQLKCGADVVCGVVDVHDWASGEDAVRRQFDKSYFPMDGHRHIHGANLGMSASAYRCSGGFRPLSSDEDVDMVRRLEHCDVSMCWSGQSKVWTSARNTHRAPEGFGATLNRLRLLVSGPAPAVTEPDSRTPVAIS